MNVCLQKAKAGETWKGVFERHILNASAIEADKKRLILERFQTEVSCVHSLETYSVDGFAVDSMLDLISRVPKSQELPQMQEHS